MSIKAMEWAWKQASTLPIASVLVLVAIADYADDQGEAWPSYDTLAKKTGAARRTVANAVADLERRGRMVVENRRADNGRQRLNLYRLVIDTEPSASAALRIADVPASGDRIASDRVHVTTEPSAYDDRDRVHMMTEPSASAALIYRKNRQLGTVSVEPSAQDVSSESQKPPLLTEWASSKTDVVVDGDAPTIDDDLYACIPRSDDPVLQECVLVYRAEWNPTTMKPLFGWELSDHNLEAWRAHVVDAEHGEPPDDIVGMFRAEVRRCAAEGTKDSFSSVMKRSQRWQERNDDPTDGPDRRALLDAARLY